MASAVAGAMLPLAFAPFAWYPLAILSPAILFALWLEAPAGLAFRRGFVFGVGLFGVGVSWVYVAIHDYGYTGAPIAALLTALFVVALSLYPALAGAAGAWLRDRLAVRPAAVALFLLPALWVLFEWIRGRFLTGFTWLQLGYSQIDSPLSHLAPIGGVYAVSLLCALTAGWLVHAARRRSGWPVAAAALVWAASTATGALKWSEPVGEPLRIAIIQGNLPQITKWDAEQVQRRLDLYARLTLERLGKDDLLVWPENAITLFYHDLAESYFDPLAQRAHEAGTDLVVGLPVMDLETGRYFSSLMSLGGHFGFYHKRHLVPFGEFVPLEGMFRGLIHFFDLPMSSFSRGPTSQSPLKVAGQRAGASICYEDAFGEEVIDVVPEATLLINGSNNAWYGDSLAPHQHLQIARMRALETARPIVRATTTGISALIDARGRITARSPPFETHVLTGQVQPQTGLTPYVRWGNVPVLLVVLVMVGLTGLRPVLKSAPQTR